MSLHVETLGRGPDLVMLHGWALHSGIWAGMQEPLSRHFRLHLLDLPGHGQSVAGDSQTFDAWVSEIAAMLPERAAVCGWSLGGQIALELAVREPRRVERVILVSTTPSFITRGDWTLGIEPGVLEQFAKDLAIDYASTLQRFLALQVRGSIRSTDILRALKSMIFVRGRPSPAALEAGLGALLNNDLRSRVRQVSQPALVIHGSRDVLCPPQAGEWLAGHLPNARLRLLSHCGHAPFLSCPGEISGALSDFLHGD